jgi:7-carboxy-7-deazaguanine synthase
MRVVEVFGPTIQGEGPFAGRACHFLRLGGCDYRCSWCDTPQAVEPRLVRQAEDLDAAEVLERLAVLEPAPMLVISGGNPALHHLGPLIGELRERYGKVCVETQGSVFRPWLADVDSLVVSPKPPSSGMDTLPHMLGFQAFMSATAGLPGLVLKIVVFDEDDLRWAKAVALRYSWVPLYLSVGTELDTTDEEVLVQVAERYAWLAETVAHDPSLHRAVVLPQLHVIAWRHRVGV